MSYHSFSLDPRTVLGVGPDAALDEIHEAYRAKSKKHHPDVGGDEWAFRMVARAYEVLTATTSAPRFEPCDRFGADTRPEKPSPGWRWVGSSPHVRPGDPFVWNGPAGANETNAQSHSDTVSMIRLGRMPRACNRQREFTAISHRGCRADLDTLRAGWI